MNKTLIFIMLVMTLFMSACTNVGTGDSGSGSQKIVASFYPVEEITKALLQGNEGFEVTLLIPKGADPHSFEPTPRQLQELSDAEIFVTMGGMFEHIEEDVLEVNPDIKVIESTHFLGEYFLDDHDHDLETSESDSEHNHEESHTEPDSHSDSDSLQDPHIWLSIHNMELMTDEIAEHLIEFYPLLEDEIKLNSIEYKQKLEELEEKYEEGLEVCMHDEIIVNHKAFGYLAQDYGFDQISVAGFSPESEPTPKGIANVVDEAREHNLSYVFSEGALNNNVANTIANDIDGEVLELNPLLQQRHNNYFDMMEENLEQLRIGLECE